MALRSSRKGTLPVPKITPCFENGKGALAKGAVERHRIRNDLVFHVIRPHDPADADYLHQITMTRSFRTGGQRHMTGSAGQRRVPAEFIEDFPLFIMGDTQRRVDQASCLRSWMSNSQTWIGP